tara:strand:- start:285 stop:1544 length:1260 start_codon:yes stop_codon:yes gene_type:complete
MIKILNYKSKKDSKNLLKFLNERRDGNSINTSVVDKILRDIKKNKIKAVLKYEKKFDNNKNLYPTKRQIKNSIKSLDIKVKKAIDLAYSRIFKFHSLQKSKNIKYFDKYKNKIEYVNIPINSVGIYVPANLPSTLLMNAIPSKICGVKNIILANPKLKGKLNPAVMYAAKKCGIDKIVNVGGAQAIGALAYVYRVDKIVGPGGDYVAYAKRRVFGEVGIEGMIAGPSEVTVIADKNSNINQIVTSLAAQSEHGPNSQSILVTSDKEVITKTKYELNKLINKLPRKNIIVKSLKKNGLIIFTKNKSQMVDVVNIISPEHLEIITKDYKFFNGKIYNAGSIGLGKYSPVAASDYNVGTNHTLGTLGSSKFSSGLNLSDFYKKISQFTLSKKGIEVIGKQAITLAEYENLHAHALSIKSRFL